MHINNINLPKKILTWYDNNKRTLPWRISQKSKKNQNKIIELEHQILKVEGSIMELEKTIVDKIDILIDKSND